MNGFSKDLNNNILEFKYNELELDTRLIIDKYFISSKLNRQNQFILLIIPYNNCEDINTKKVAIIDTAKEFLIKAKIDPSYASKLVSTWHDFFDHSASSKSFEIEKKDFLWIIIAELITINKYDSILEDESLIDEVENKYNGLIESSILNFEKSNKIIGIYYELAQSMKISITDFVNTNINYLSDVIFGRCEIDEVEEATVLVIVNSILRNRTRINNIKEEGNL